MAFSVFLQSNEVHREHRVGVEEAEEEMEAKTMGIKSTNVKADSTKIWLICSKETFWCVTLVFVGTTSQNWATQNACSKRPLFSPWFFPTTSRASGDLGR